MNIQDIPPLRSPVDLSKAVECIIASQSYTGQQVLRSMSDEQILSLWQFGLSEAQILSDHNVANGEPPIKYPHLWVRSNLFKLIYKRWLLREEDAIAFLQSLESVRSELEIPVKRKAASSKVEADLSPIGEDTIRDWNALYRRKRQAVLTGAKESYCIMPPLNSVQKTR